MKKTILLLAATVVPAAWGTPLIYNFAGANVVLGTSQTFTDNGITITAYGFTDPSTPTDLYQKNTGGDELGLGLVGDSDHEIEADSFIQLDLQNYWAANPANVQMSMGSVQPGEGYIIFGSSILGTLGTEIQSGSVDMTAFNLTSSADTYRYLSVQATTGDILLSTLSDDISGVPEPGSMLLTGSALLALCLSLRKLR